MSLQQVPWQQLKVAPDRTHHLLDRRPAYAERFLSVLKFHPPGLAAVKNPTGAFHINPQGEPPYSHRFLQTFGFYEERAAVEDASGWYHILPDGTALYPQRFAWCGNYQEGYCTVQDLNGLFFHINPEGKRAYEASFPYAGDFHDGAAVIQNTDGLHTHIDPSARELHGQCFLDLDVYHKGFARAKDEQGWFHLDFKGDPIYPERYKNIEPFYNGIARVETPLGALYRINEEGKKVEMLRSQREDEFHQVSAELVSYWRFYTLQAASDYDLFDHLPNSVEGISKLTGLHPASALKLLKALQEMGFVSYQGVQWCCTPSGAFLTSDHPYSLKKACRLWAQEHLECWRQMNHTLVTGQPTFNAVFGKGWFQWLKDHPEKNELYHETLSIYAKRDYHTFATSIDLSKHRSLLDVGGSTGALLFDILHHHSHLQGFLLDLPHVTQLLKIPLQFNTRLQVVSANFFEDWPPLQVESVVLSRVLHDWPDFEAVTILKKVHATLISNPDNRLYLIENIQNENRIQGALLNLHMGIMTGGVERTLKDFENLLEKTGFILEATKPLNEVSSVLIAKKI